MGRGADGSLAIRTLGDLVDEGYSLSLHCHNSPRCSRTLDCDVYDLTERFSRDFNFYDCRLPVRCGRCGSRKISMSIGPETRPRDLVKIEGPKNMRRDRTPAERAAALAMIALEERAKFGLTIDLASTAKVS